MWVKYFSIKQFSHKHNFHSICANVGKCATASNPVVGAKCELYPKLSIIAIRIHFSQFSSLAYCILFIASFSVRFFHWIPQRLFLTSIVCYTVFKFIAGVNDQVWLEVLNHLQFFFWCWKFINPLSYSYVWGGLTA